MDQPWLLAHSLNRQLMLLRFERAQPRYRTQGVHVGLSYPSLPHTSLSHPVAKNTV